MFGVHPVDSEAIIIWVLSSPGLHLFELTRKKWKNLEDLKGSLKLDNIQRYTTRIVYVASKILACVACQPGLGSTQRSAGTTAEPFEPVQCTSNLAAGFSPRGRYRPWARDVPKLGHIDLKISFVGKAKHKSKLNKALATLSLSILLLDHKQGKLLIDITLLPFRFP